MYKVFMLFVLLSCTHKNNSEQTTLLKQNITRSRSDVTQAKPDIKGKIRENQLASKKDPVCGMPAYKYLKDTILYKTKIYGFCGKGCKDEFLKDPKSFIH